MANRKAKNVKRFIGIISKNVEEDAYHGGGEGGKTLNTGPYVVFAANNTINIDFSAGTYPIKDPFYPEGGVLNQYLIDTKKTYLSSEGEGGNLPSVAIQSNEEGNQLIAHLFINDCEEYQRLSSDIVIYEGDVAGLEDTSTIASNLPKVEFTINSDYTNTFVGSIKEGLSVTN